MAIWGDGKADVKLSAQAKKGLARAFLKFDAYQLAKYNRKAPVTLRDVMFMVHPKPKDKAQQEIFKQLASNTLPAQDTWEVGLSTGADKGETFTRLLTEKKLGYMALLRNLRNMVQAQVDRDLIREALVAGAYKSKALPFRFVSAAKHAPEFEPELDNAMQAAMSGLDRLDGSTAVLIDVSGSMDAALSKRSEMTRREAGAALAILVGGVCDRWDCFIFGDVCVQFPARANLSLVEKVREVNKQSYYHFLDHGEKRDRYTVGHGTNIGHAVKQVNDTYDRIIVVTDCQSHDALPNPKGKGYIINTAPYKNGVGYGPWTMIDGFSEATVRFISEVERD